MIQKRFLYYKSHFFRFYQDNEVLVSVCVFVAGFVFDLITLGRIDDFFNLIQQAVYLAILGTVLVFEIKEKLGSFTPGPWLDKYWKYKDLFVHFLFGSLLSAYTIFYYTSASALTSFFFITLLVGLMLANEFPQVQKLGTTIRVILFSICLLSYFAFFYPVLLGHVGVFPFWLSFMSSALSCGLVWRSQFSKKEEHKKFLHASVSRPIIGVHLFFLVGYYFALIPPVPVAVKKIGVYYNVTKENGDYKGHHLNAGWKFWNKGSQKFYSRQGDKIVVLMSIFSPTRFQDKVFIKWFYNHPTQGWSLQDTIPLSILGGRDEGFRGYGEKLNYMPGKWKVEVETSDGREVGSIKFTVGPDVTSEPRTFNLDTF